MIKYITNNEIDYHKWDNCILNSVNGIAYAYSWYLDIVHEGWAALVEEDYERVMPLPLKTKYGISYLLQPFFTQQLGVFSVSNLNSDIVGNFISSIPSHIKVIDLNFNHFNVIGSGKYEIIENTNYLLDLISDYSKLASSYSKNTKRNLKKALSSKLIVSKGVKPEELINLFRNNRGADLHRWNDSSYKVLSRLMYTAIHKGVGTTYGVYTEYNELCASAFFLNTNNNIIFLFSGTNGIARTNGAMTFLIDSVIKKNSPDTRVLDFEGSNNTNLARYYKGFGSKKTNYLRLKINRLNPIVKLIYKLLSHN